MATTASPQQLQSRTDERSSKVHKVLASVADGSRRTGQRRNAGTEALPTADIKHITFGLGEEICLAGLSCLSQSHAYFIASVELVQRMHAGWCINRK